MINPVISSRSPLRPMQHAEHQLLTLILNGTYPPGATLPNERGLAQEIGVTRSTLRETLQRLAREGWVTIRQGKPTQVNDFWQEGGLSLLGTLARFGEFLPMQFISHLLEIRILLLPEIARAAVAKAPEMILGHLETYGELGEDASGFVAFDWDLQLLMARASRNPVCVMILNDFQAIFQRMAIHYFALPGARRASRRYYQRLTAALAERRDSPEAIVREAMRESMDIWLEMQAKI